MDDQRSDNPVENVSVWTIFLMNLARGKKTRFNETFGEIGRRSRVPNGKKQCSTSRSATRLCSDCSWRNNILIVCRS
ncbi:hypothetical protein L596_020254 [Steinernema carpocapsae]|uniref:Uncharacterized protein n=1 Tax=Steinernema carpocapsae TaxID=34508 RepID=A0A4V6XVZ9_STECR|nr:hypothetical protein L596_020254 [Steinernema carpocapsae]